MKKGFLIAAGICFFAATSLPAQKALAEEDEPVIIVPPRLPGLPTQPPIFINICQIDPSICVRVPNPF